MNRDIIAFTKYKFNVYGNKDIRSGKDSAVVGIVGKSKSLDFPTMLIFWSLVRNSVVLAVYLLFSVACFLTVHEHFDKEYTSYNVNADDAACAVAKALKAEKLAFLTDVEGVYKDFNDKSSLIEKISISEIEKLIENGQMGGGMLPKLSNCVDAVKNGVNRVTIADGRVAHCLLLEMFTNKGIGTMIVGDQL